MIVVIAFAVLLLLGIPISMVVLGSATIGIMAFSNVPLQIVIQQLFSGLNNYVLLAIPFFIVSGAIAAKGNTAKHLTEVMTIIFGRLRGGSVIATIAACTFFAAISGSSVATVIAIGIIMIPNLIEAGYPEKMAIGTITAGGSIGVLIPPSAPMIALCVAYNASVGRMFIGGVMPGLILALAWAVYIFFVCKKDNLGTLRKYELKEAMRIIFSAIPALIYPVIVLGSIYGGYATPTEAACISIVYIFFIELFIYKTISLKEMFFIVKDSIINAVTITFIISASQVLTWLVTTKQVPLLISNWIIMNMSTKAMFLLLIMGLFFVAGCFMELVALMIILGPILAPTLTAFNIDPVHFGIICIMAAQVSYITPPFGLNLFVSMNITKKGLFEIGRASLPYLLILIVVMLVVAFVPQISLWLPNMMMR